MTAPDVTAPGTSASHPVRAASSQRVEFPGALGGVLAGRPDLPAGPPAAYALFTRTLTSEVSISTVLADPGAAEISS